jgi:hypothetical protein
MSHGLTIAALLRMVRWLAGAVLLVAFLGTCSHWLRVRADRLMISPARSLRTVL